MVKPFTGFITEDGHKFDKELDAHKHEISVTISKEMPALKSSIGAIMDNVDRLAEILSPLSPKANQPPLSSKKPPLGQPTPEVGKGYKFKRRKEVQPAILPAGEVVLPREKREPQIVQPVSVVSDKDGNLVLTKPIPLYDDTMGCV